MANTGHFCVLFDNPKDAEQFEDRFAEFVSDHLDLKNLYLSEIPNDDPRYYRIVGGECDRLRLSHLKDFFEGTIPKGVHVFVIDSIYGDEWQQVQ